MKHLALAASVFLLAQPCHAVGRLANVTIIDRDSGSSLPTYYFRGEYWVAGAPGARYAIAIRNNLGGRVLAVTSVDGVNILTGDTARWDQTGYVFGPSEFYQITGWRKSQYEVADFEFSDAANSYAQRTGRPANLGVIGVALFKERLQEPPSAPLVAPPAPLSREGDSARERGSAAAGSAFGRAAPSPAEPLAESAQPPAAKLGTAHGAREQSYVQYTDFVRASEQPNEIIRIRYDSRENLIAMGVIRHPPPITITPNPFPDSPVAHYVPDPPPYR